MTEKIVYVCHGEFRGDCDVEHRTVEAAARHCRRDSNGARRQGGWSDRFPTRRVTDEHGRSWYDRLSEWESDVAHEIIG